MQREWFACITGRCRFVWSSQPSCSRVSSAEYEMQRARVVCVNNIALQDVCSRDVRCMRVWESRNSRRSDKGVRFGCSWWKGGVDLGVQWLQVGACNCDSEKTSVCDDNCVVLRTWIVEGIAVNYSEKHCVKFSIEHCCEIYLLCRPFLYYFIVFVFPIFSSIYEFYTVGLPNIR